MEERKDSFLKGAIILGAAGIIVKVMGAFFRIPLGNLIGSNGMGYYQAAYPVYNLFLTLATAGFPTALAKLVSEKNAIGDHKGANRIFKVAYMVLLITGLVSFSILFFGSKYIVNDIMKNPGAYYAMLAIAPALLFVPAMSSYRGYFQGKKDMGKIAISQITEQFFRVVLGVSLAYYFMQKSGPKMGAAGAIAGATIGAVGSMVYLIVAYIKDGKNRKAQIKESKEFKEDSIKEILRKILVVAVPITIGAAVMPLVNMVDNVLVTRRLMDGGYSLEQAVSLFGQLTGMAMTIVNLPTVITSAIGMSLVPSISEAFALGELDRASKDTKSSIKITLLVVLPCAFGLAALAEPIMNLLYPAETGLGEILFTVSPAIIFLGLIFSLNGILQGMGKPMIPVIALSIGMMFKIVVSYSLTVIPQINVKGSGLGTITAYAVASLIELYFVKKYMGVKFGVKDIIVKPLITVIAMFISVKIGYILFANILGLGNTIGTLVGVCIGVLVYAIVLIGIGGISEDEILMLPKGEKIYKLLNKCNLVK